jgi:hypothetical protein
MYSNGRRVYLLIDASATFAALGRRALKAALDKTYELISPTIK